AKDFKKQKSINPKLKAENFIDTDLKKISWTVNLKNDVEKGVEHKYNSEKTYVSNYRPFMKQNLYFDKSLIERPGVNRDLFPNGTDKNLIIALSGVGSSKDFSALISDKLTTYDLLEKSQMFPLYYHEENTSAQKGLFDEGSDSEYIRRDAISDFIYERAKKQYGKSVTKEDIFYYVYGFLHSKEYRETFANDLKKMLPRLP